MFAETTGPVRLQLIGIKTGVMAEAMESTDNLRVVLFSFGYKYGPPVDVNLLLDVRFLPNPYWEPILRPKDGRDEAVAEFVLTSPDGRQLTRHVTSLLRYLVDAYGQTGKTVLRVAVGCTGGRHRSVAVVEMLAEILREKPRQLTVFHRDIERDAAESSE